MGVVGDFRKPPAIGGYFSCSCFRAMVMPGRNSQLKQIDRESYAPQEFAEHKKLWPNP
jgi:hypothetical protein